MVVRWVRLLLHWPMVVVVYGGFGRGLLSEDLGWFAVLWGEILGGSLGCVVVVMWCEEVKGFGIQEVLFRSAVFAPPLVLFYYDDEHILLVTGDRLFMIWVVVPLQTDVAARLLLLNFAFL